MAIPFTLPSDQETEDHYRRLNQLILEFYELLQILIRPQRLQGSHVSHVDQESRRIPPVLSHSSSYHNSDSNNTAYVHQDSAVPPASATSAASFTLNAFENHNLPDLVLNSVPPSSGVQGSSKVLPPRKQRRKQSKTEKRTAPQLSHSINLAFGLEHHASSSSHHQVSNRLVSSTEGVESVCNETKSIKVKASSLVSLLVPQSVTGHIWTTLIIIVGWKLLARHR